MKNSPVNWFDIVAVGILVLGLYRGRKRGISEELIDLLKWLAVIVACSHAYRPLGGLIVRQWPIFSLYTCYVASYLVVAVAVHTLFNMIKRIVGDKLISSDFFGRHEYSMGILAGGIRYACYLLMFLALFNGRMFRAEALAADNKQQQELFGNIRLPGLNQLQSDILFTSMTGKLVRENLPDMLIAPSDTKGRGPGKREGTGKRLERQIDDVLNPNQVPPPRKK